MIDGCACAELNIQKNRFCDFDWNCTELLIKDEIQNTTKKSSNMTESECYDSMREGVQSSSNSNQPEKA